MSGMFGGLRVFSQRGGGLRAAQHAHAHASSSARVSFVRRNYATHKDIPNKPPPRTAIIPRSQRPFNELSTADKVAEATKTGGYGAVILAGVGMAGLMLYGIASEVLFSSGPTKILNQSFKEIKNNEEVQAALGGSLKAYGDRVGRRRSVVQHQEYQFENDTFVRVKFNVEGDNGLGTAHAEMKKTMFGGYEFRYLYVEVPTFRQKPKLIVLIDNR